VAGKYIFGNSIITNGKFFGFATLGVNLLHYSISLLLIKITEEADD
jgi:hypothetical protein